VIYGVIFLKFSEITKNSSDEFIRRVIKMFKKCNNILVVDFRNTDNLTFEKIFNIPKYDKMKLI
jgi:hypothetical protein